MLKCKLRIFFRISGKQHNFGTMMLGSKHRNCSQLGCVKAIIYWEDKMDLDKILKLDYLLVIYKIIYK